MSKGEDTMIDQRIKELEDKAVIEYKELKKNIGRGDDKDLLLLKAIEERFSQLIPNISQDTQY